MKILLAVAVVMLAACANAGDHGETSDVDADIGPGVDACTPTLEVCDDKDNDCDGRIDEEFSMKGADCEAGVGACEMAGQMRCNGVDLSCDATPGLAASEQCDGIDNDCDMMVDEDFHVGAGCDGADADTCLDGMVVCDTLTTTRCTDMEGTSAEVCDGIDNDCDGHIDENFGLGVACDGADSDACNEGMVVCNGSGGTMCSDVTSNNLELCDGLDNDCKNGVDDTFNIGQSCNVGLGLCTRGGQFECNTAQTGTACSATAGAPIPEECGNGVDEDCNGTDALCPTNDFAAGAIDISPGGTFAIDLSGAHDDNWTTGCGLQGGRDVFYTFTLAATEVVYFDTFGSNFDSVVRVYPGSCTAIGALAQCALDSCSTPQSQLAAEYAAGTYCLVVDQQSAAVVPGSMLLNFRRGNRAGLPLTASPINGNTTGHADLSTGPTCEPNTHQPDDAYFYTTCPGTHTLNANTCSTSTARDTVLYARSGAATSTELVCDDDSCTASGNNNGQIPPTQLQGANLQWLIVDGFGTGASGVGAYVLKYTLQ